MPFALSFPLIDLFPADALLATVLDLSPGGVVLCTPVCNEAGTLVDMALAYLNPAAQRLLCLPAHPAATFTQHFAGSRLDGRWAALRAGLLAPAARSFPLA